MAVEIMGSRFLFGAAALGILISLASGFVMNESGVGIPEINHYGYPLVWRVTDLNGPTQYVLTNLVVDISFWISTSLAALIVLRGITVKSGITADHRTLITILVLFIPLGFAMDFIHEFGHATWGTAAGGRLAYMKIAYLEICPRLASFDLGLARVDGLDTDYAYGLMLLGGSMTTNIASWSLALVTLGPKLRPRTQLALRIIGLLVCLTSPSTLSSLR